MARLKQLQGDQSGAIALLDKAEALLRQPATGHGSGSFGHRRELAQLLLERGRSQDVTEALSLMQAELGIRRDAQTLDTLAWALSRAGRWRDAQRVMQEALSSGIREPGLFWRSGEIEQALGNQSQAIAYFQLAQQTDPTFNEQARQALGLGL
jgi:tetratricopeptide (TPR) repeat protein